MALVRTNITLPEETLALVDAVAGPRGRSAYIADVVARQVRRDNARKVFRETAGALKGSPTWGQGPEQTDLILRELRGSWDRDDRLWGATTGGADALPAGHDPADRPRPRSVRRARARGAPVQRAE